MYIHAYSFCIYTLSLDYSVPESVCMHGISLLPLMCSCVASSFCALVSSCSYSAHPSVCLSMLHFYFFLLCSCCTALCYRCFQLVCAWHPTVYCPEPPCLHARPLPPPVYINRSLMLSGNRHASQLSPSTFRPTLSHQCTWRLSIRVTLTNTSHLTLVVPSGLPGQ